MPLRQYFMDSTVMTQPSSWSESLTRVGRGRPFPDKLIVPLTHFHRPRFHGSTAGSQEQEIWCMVAFSAFLKMRKARTAEEVVEKMLVFGRGGVAGVLFFVSYSLLAIYIVLLTGHSPPCWPTHSERSCYLDSWSWPACWPSSHSLTHSLTPPPPLSLRTDLCTSALSRAPTGKVRGRR